MTTIAYDHKNKMIACDSRLLSGDDIIMSDTAIKMIEKNGVFFWWSGGRSDGEKLIDAYLSGASKSNLDASMFVWDGEKLCLCGTSSEGELYIDSVEYNNALGSGRKLALAAMDLGKTAREAVEYAKTRDPYSGGDVHVYSLHDLKNEATFE